ncbi:DUF2544 domain-containing protein, partial [Escherichia coli]|nr:DUF2544 domain-containing protein [Escherichia coli]
MKKWTFFLAALLLLIVNVGTSKSYAGSKLM